MVDVAIALTASLLMAIMGAVETFGYKFRELGVLNGTPSLGYSCHVQIATYARLGSMISLPLMAWLIDGNKGINLILLIPIVSSLLFACLTLLLIKSKIVETFSHSIFKMLTRRYTQEREYDSGTSKKSYSKQALTPEDRKYIVFCSFLSYSLTVIGVYSAYTAAALMPAYRATLIQSAPLVTSLGTFISVTYFDPRISHLNDSVEDVHNVTSAISSGRLIASLGIFLIFSLFYISYNTRQS